MAAQAFAEVVGTPYTVYVAPVGTAFPAVDLATPIAPWTVFGVNGQQNLGEKGITVAFTETLTSFKPGGDTIKVKDVRTEEDFTVTFSVVDTTVENLSAILDGATITTVAATTALAGQKSIKLKRGPSVKYFALLVRGLSPYDDGTGLNAQYEFSRVCQTGNQSIAYVPGSWAEVDCQFDIRGNLTGTDPGLYRGQTAPHS